MYLIDSVQINANILYILNNFMVNIYRETICPL